MELCSHEHSMLIDGIDADVDDIVDVGLLKGADVIELTIEDVIVDVVVVVLVVVRPV